MRLYKSDKAKEILANPKRASALLRRMTGEKMSFEKQLLIVMEEQKLYNLQEIARRSDVAVSTVFRWLKGTVAPHPDVQERLLKLMRGIPLEDGHFVVLRHVQKHKPTSLQLLEGARRDSNFPNECSVRVIINDLVADGFVEEGARRFLRLTPKGKQVLEEDQEIVRKGSQVAVGKEEPLAEDFVPSHLSGKRIF